MVLLSNFLAFSLVEIFDWSTLGLALFIFQVEIVYFVRQLEIFLLRVEMQFIIEKCNVMQYHIGLNTKTDYF